jgi:enoyl-CoA hydratase
MAELRTVRDGQVAVVTLDAPERRNALTVDLGDEILAAFDEVEDDESVGAVVVTGAPPAFCAGADLSHLGQSQREGLLKIYEGFLRVARSPLPTVAAVNGPAVGAGLNLALACDVILAGESARFDTRFLQLGLHPGGGHTWMMRHRIGAQAAAALVLFGEVLDGRAAEQARLAWRCFPDGDLVAEATAFAARAAAGPPELVAKIKRTLNDIGRIPTHEEAVERELDPQVWSVSQPAFAEKLAAMQAKTSRK